MVHTPPGHIIPWLSDPVGRMAYKVRAILELALVVAGLDCALRISLAGSAVKLLTDQLSNLQIRSP